MCVLFLQTMVFTFFYCVVWMLIVAGFSGVLFYHIQAKLVCNEFDGTPTGLDDLNNCFHYADKGAYGLPTNRKLALFRASDLKTPTFTIHAQNLYFISIAAVLVVQSFEKSSWV